MSKANGAIASGPSWYSTSQHASMVPSDEGQQSPVSPRAAQRGTASQLCGTSEEIGQSSPSSSASPHSCSRRAAANVGTAPPAPAPRTRSVYIPGSKSPALNSKAPPAVVVTSQSAPSRMAEEAPAPLCALTMSAPAASTRAANRGSTEWTLPETLPFAAPAGTIQVVGSRNAAPLPPSASTVAIRLTGANSSPASYSTANVSRPPSSSSDAAAYESG